MREMPFNLKIYVLLIIILGIIPIFIGLFEIKHFHIYVIIFFIILSMIAELATIKVNETISMSVTFGMGLASLLVFKSSIVSLVGFFSLLFSIKLVNGKVQHLFNFTLYKRLFNSCAYSISLFMANLAYNISNVNVKFMFFEYNIISIFVSIIVFAITNIGIFDILLTMIEKKKFIDIVKKNIWVIINIIAISPLGILIALIYKSYGLFAILLFFGPLLLARYSFKLYVDMKQMYSETISALTNAIDAKDKYTFGHANRVADYAVEIARNMKFGEGSIDKIKTAAILHDIGKIGIHDYILNKPGKLEVSEYAEIQKHPMIGYNILNQVNNLTEVAIIIKYHHERYEGGGYPEGIGGDNIPIESYILAVADSFDAMTSDRPYRKAMMPQEAIDIVISESGRQFHPLVVEAFKKFVVKKGDFSSLEKQSIQEELAHVN